LSLGAVALAHAEVSLSTITLDSVTTDSSNATADGTFADGWKWEFHFTVPAGETSFKMKFSDFTHGTDSVPASDARIFSEQSDHNSESNAIAGDSNDTMSLTGDLNSDAPDRQIVVVVEVSIPSGTPGGNYSASYDVDSEVPPDTQAPIIMLNGNATIGLFVGGTYTEQGATATDNVDGTDPVTIGGDTVTTAAPGTFHITYDAVDAAGNHAVQVIRTVNVIPGFLPPPCPPFCAN
jgi:hypothetical protein